MRLRLEPIGRLDRSVSGGDDERRLADRTDIDCADTDRADTDIDQHDVDDHGNRHELDHRSDNDDQHQHDLDQ